MEPVISQLSAGDVESSTGGMLSLGSRERRFFGVSIDTRTLRDGDLFFAIRGANQDGHRFIPDALSKGAAGAVVESGYSFPGEYPQDCVLLKVEDTHQALKNLARAVRLRWRGNLAAITGSMGKTTSKEFAAHILRSRFLVFRSPGNYNNLYGLPLALFGLRSDDQIGIFEMGMSAPGEIAEMCRIASPDTGIITNVAAVHLQFFSSLDAIARAKGELAEALSSEGTLIYNADDPRVVAIAGRFRGHKISFGFSDDAQVRADQIDIVSFRETRFRLFCAGAFRSATLPLPGAHYVMNALPGIALGCQYNIPPDQIVESLRDLPQASMRGQVLRFKEGFTVIDDSYNSNPQALMRMIELLSKLPSFKRRILLAGEMLELGPESNLLHSECGIFAANHGLDMVIGIQGAAREIVQAATKAGRLDSKACFFADADAASDFIRNEIREGDLVLVKGSRGVRMEKIIKSLQSHFEISSL
jgi:UDP-N-acetylmuramoyl-tripeptide--D-alanyl-D-alanine ligase